MRGALQLLPLEESASRVMIPASFAVRPLSGSARRGTPRVDECHHRAVTEERKRYWQGQHRGTGLSERTFEAGA